MSPPKSRQHQHTEETDEQDESPSAARRRKKESRGSSWMLGMLIFVGLLLYLLSDQ